MNSVIEDLKKELDKSINQKSDLLIDNTECLYLKEYIEDLEKTAKVRNATIIFADTQDMEERYCDELYKEYLENERKELKERINKSLKLLILLNNSTFAIGGKQYGKSCMQKAIQILKGESKVNNEYRRNN